MNRKQYIRLKKLVKEMQKETYPNCKSFAKKLEKIDELENLGISCTPKTKGFKPAHLAACCKEMSIKLNHHEALSDARDCAKLYLMR